MSKTKTLIAALMASTVMTAGVALAADQSSQTPQQTQQEQKTATADAGKLSADGSHGYADIALTRLAIFDGRVQDAKKFINEAEQSFNKAQHDDTVFMKAEADLKSPTDDANSTGNSAGNQAQTAPDKTASAASNGSAAGAGSANASSSSESASNTSADPSSASKQGQAAQNADTATPKRWLPVDAEMSVDESYTANPKKVAAVADANKSLAKGDKQGAMAKLKLADVNVVYVMAVVPLDQTLSDVHQAATMVDNGKYYEASQMLRQVQDSTRYDMLDVNGVPTKASGQSDKPSGKSTSGRSVSAPATH